MLSFSKKKKKNRNYHIFKEYIMTQLPIQIYQYCESSPILYA